MGLAHGRVTTSGCPSPQPDAKGRVLLRPNRIALNRGIALNRDGYRRRKMAERGLLPEPMFDMKHSRWCGEVSASSAHHLLVLAAAGQ
jgi:hypothetical protein